MNTLTGTVITSAQLTEERIDRMVHLMAKTYAGTSPQKVRRDLSNKQYILLLHNHENVLQGFSTIQLFDSEFRGRPVKILFSGDTVISEESRGHVALMHDWWQFTCQIQRQFSDRDLYWMLISKGWRTYKFLPLFYKEFYPSRLHPTPPDFQEFMARLAEKKFPGEYHDGRIIPAEPDFLKNAETDVPPRKAQDPDILFFLSRNPDFGKGHELVCLTRLALDNLTPIGRRILHDLVE